MRKESAAMSGTSKKKKSKNDASDNEFVRSTLPIHVKMFEKHRIESMRQLISALVACELRYHCRVVEDLSVVLHQLSQVDDDEC